MTLMTCQAGHGRERICGAFNEGPGRNIAKIVGGQIGKQCQPHVGWRGAVRNHIKRLLLIIVRRQPMIFWTDEGFEKRPGLSRIFL